MNMIQKSEAIKNGLRKGFRDSSSKMTHRKCCGYEVGSDGKLAVNSDEARVESGGNRQTALQRKIYWASNVPENGQHRCSSN